MDYLKARAYPIENAIKLESPGRSVTMMIEPGENVLAINNTDCSSLLQDHQLYQNYPKPFNPSTTIKYSIDKKTEVNLKIYKVLGAEVATLVNKSQDTGPYEITFNASNLSSGIYFYQLKVADKIIMKRMLLLE